MQCLKDGEPSGKADRERRENGVKRDHEGKN
jgi:hypothetical protein